MATTYIIHTPQDEDFVEGVLRAGIGLPSSEFKTWSDFEAGRSLVRAIEAAIASNAFVVVLISDAMLGDGWATFATELAVSRRADLHTDNLIPVLRNGEVPVYLSGINPVDLTNPSEKRQFEEKLSRLATRLGGQPSGEREIQCPYQGLKSYDVSTARTFFGRDGEIAALRDKLEHHRRVFVTGRSGIGKSSLVRVTASRLGPSWSVLPELRLGIDPIARLDAVLGGNACDSTVRDALATRHLGRHVLLMIDALERMFSLPRVEQDALIARFKALESDQRFTTVFSMRSDFVATDLANSLLAPIGAGESVYVAPLRDDALRSAIRDPARTCNVYIEPTLVELLVNDAANEPGSLPLVQETLVRLWKHRVLRWIPAAPYGADGEDDTRLGKALVEHGNATWNALEPTEQTIAKRILLRLIDFGHGRSDVRRQERVSGLHAGPQADVDRCIELLSDARLVTTGADALSPQSPTNRVVDLAHEALLRGWPLLEALSREFRDAELVRRKHEQDAMFWETQTRRGGFPDRSTMTVMATFLNSTKAAELGVSPLLTTFFKASEDHLRKGEQEQERQARRSRNRALWRNVALGVAVVLLALATYFYFRAQNTVEALTVAQAQAYREEQETHRLLGLADLEQGRAELQDGHPMRALAWLVAARTQGIDGSIMRTLFAQARVHPRVTLVGHSSVVTNLAYSPDGRRLITSSTDGTARIWDVATGTSIARLVGHRDSIYAAWWSPDGLRVVTVSYDHTARLWDPNHGTILGPPLIHNGPVFAGAFSPDGRFLVTGSGDNVAHVWDVGTSKEFRILQHGSAVYAVAFSRYGKYLVTGDAEGNATVWDPLVGAKLTTLPAPQPFRSLRAVSFSPNDESVLVASEDSSAHIWAWRSGGSPLISLVHLKCVNSAAFNPTGTLVVTASDDRTVRVWDARNGAQIGPSFQHHGVVNSAVFSPDGTQIVSASDDGTAQVWSLSARSSIILEHAGPVRRAVFSSDGGSIATASEDAMARLWTPPPVKELEHGAKITLAAFSHDKERAVTASEDGAIRIWNVVSGALVRAFGQHAIVIGAVFSQDHTLLATTGDDHVARIWNVAEGIQIASLNVKTLIFGASFSPDGSHIVTATDDGAQIWDPRTAANVRFVGEKGAAITAADFDNDGSRFVTASRRGAVVWSATTGLPLLPIEHDKHVTVVKFSPNGSRIATAIDDDTNHIVRIWDAKTGAPVSPPLSHPSMVKTIAFGPDDERVVTACSDNKVRIWNILDGRPTATPLDLEGGSFEVSFSLDGRRVMTTSESSARMWDAVSGKAITTQLGVDGINVFTIDGDRLLTAAHDDVRARILELEDDGGPAEEWRLVAQCSPYSIYDGVLVPNTNPVIDCNHSTGGR